LGQTQYPACLFDDVFILIGVDNGVFKICLIGSHFTILGSGLSYYAFAESVLFAQRNCINGFRITMFLLTISVIFLALRI
jgi:hypothetical protein